MRSRQNLSLKIGGALVSFLVAMALFAPWLAPYSPLQDFSGAENLRPSLEAHGTGQTFWLGTDALGRDLLSRLIFGARICLWMSLMAVSLAALIGVPLGLLSGFFPRLDSMISRGIDILLSFPSILIAILIVAILGPGLWNAVIAVAVTNVPSFLKLTRAQTLQEVGKDYVLAGRALGLSTPRLLLRHILPNIVPSLVVISTLNLGTAILESAALSFLNLGVSPPTAEWGLMIRAGMEDLLSVNPWVTVLSGLCILLNVLAFNLLGDGLKERLDPLHKVR